MTGHPDDVPCPPVPPPGKRPRGAAARLFLRLFSLGVFLTLAAGSYIAWDAWNFLNIPAAAPGQSIVVNIEPGMSLGSIAAVLEEQGVVRNARRFALLARWERKAQKLQAGRFLLNSGWLPREVLDQIASGRAMLYRVTVPEGKPWWEVARIMEEAGMCKAEDFARVIRDPEFLRHWGIPFPDAEGFLYPDTYFLLHPRELDEKAARSLANRMVETFWKKADPLWPQGRPDVATLKRAIILASIVEKETGVPGERDRVAGVYANRLKKNMLLQADPTIIYGLGPAFSGSLLRSQLDDASNPYNTYRHAGLPPGPICSPGAASLRAALNPESHNYLYFVATGTGASHVFSTTLEQHNRAVRAYRDAVRQRGN